MTAEPWFDPRAMVWVGSVGGSLVGLWGGVFGALCSGLVPKGRGQSFLIGSLYTQIAVGVAALLFGLVALAAGQPYVIWYPGLLLGVLLAGLGVPFVFALRQQYRQFELRKMRADELG
jgi:hypothetical protein